MEAEKVTIGVVNYNGFNTLPQSIESIRGLNHPAREFIVVDNNSSDGSREWIEEHCPEFRCIFLTENRGPSGARDIILSEAKTEFVFIMDNDIILESDALDQLMEVIEAVPEAAVCHPEIRDKMNPAINHYNGGWVHYICALIPRNEVPGQRLPYEKFDIVSGGALLIRQDAARRVGGFDADFFFNWEDSDFTARLSLAGYLCLNVPKAVGYHKYKPRGTEKVFYQVRNRWFFILKLYSWRTLLVGIPMFLLFEFSQALFLLMQGASKDYFKGTAAVFKNLPAILRKRKAFQAIKKKRDRDWLRKGDLFVPEAFLQNRSIRAVKKIYCGLFNVYWEIIRPFC